MLERLSLVLPGTIQKERYLPSEHYAYEKKVELFFGTGRAFAFWKGRVALYAILKALGIVPGDEVIVPGYTCVMVPGAVIYSGAKPVYVDIEPNYFGIRPDEVSRSITGRTKAVLVQHTYGLPSAVKEICQIAKRHSIPVIEDCCHTFGGRLDRQLLGTFGEAAFFSSQWNKPFSTGLGGLALVNNDALARRVAQEQARYQAPSRTAALMLAMQYQLHRAVVYPSTTAKIVRLFRWLTRKGLVIGSSNHAEFGLAMPHDYALRMSSEQCRLGVRKLANIQTNNTHRLRIAEWYFSELPKLGYSVPALPGCHETPILKFPLRVGNKAEALAKAAEFGVEIGSWFECPLHPIETDHAAFGYQKGDCPEAEKAAREVINLPTHLRVSPKDVEKTLAFIKKVCCPPLAKWKLKPSPEAAQPVT